MGGRLPRRTSAEEFGRLAERVDVSLVFDCLAKMLGQLIQTQERPAVQHAKPTGSLLLELPVDLRRVRQGVDLPGDLLKAVVVVGLPLQKPDLETKELIDYYDNKYQKGWDYGYTFPAITKCLQGAGRCIRSETDRGVIAFLDERFVWPSYMKCFPPDWNIKITRLYEDRVKEFFG